jgi:hypothetical protein
MEQKLAAMMLPDWVVFVFEISEKYVDGGPRMF